MRTITNLQKFGEVKKSDISIIAPENIDYLYEKLFDENEYLKILPAEEYKELPFNHLRQFAHFNRIYQFPTLELCEFIKEHCDLSTTIEIGAGNGSLAHYLNIPATDNKLQNKPEIKLLYSLSGQPTTKYGDNIEEYEAIDAVKKFKPETVVAQWVTHEYNEKEHFRGGNIWGVDEKQIIDSIRKYIFIGNTVIHNVKPILELPHIKIKAKWLVSRAKYQSENIIYIFERA